MQIKKKIFKNNKKLPVDVFVNQVLYDKSYGYYSKKNPFGKSGDFITAPLISQLFSEMVAVWLIKTWQVLGRPKNFNIVELGPGNGELTKVLLRSFKNFKEFYKFTNIFLYEKSLLLKKFQKKNISNNKVKWIKEFSEVKKGPVIFIGNEFFDAIPIKQFVRKNKKILEKKFRLKDQNFIQEIFTKASKSNISHLKKYQTIKKNKFMEFPKIGFQLIDKIVRKINKNSGGILLIDYGYLKTCNKSTLQSVKDNKRNKVLQNLGQADITSLVNFKLLEEYFYKKKLKVEDIVTQGFFLKKLGIVQRANNISQNMNFSEKSDLYYRIQRLVDPKYMGELFKVIFAHKLASKKFVGFN